MHKILSYSLFFFSLSSLLDAQTTLTVNVAGDSNSGSGGTFSSNAGDLRGCLNHINENSGSYEVLFNLSPATITLSNILPLLNLNAKNNLTINGNGVTIDGGGNYPGFFLTQGPITIQNLTFQNCLSQGGEGGTPGGGGAMGAGGALFIDLAQVTVQNVQFLNNQATGGNGGGVAGAAAGSNSGNNVGGGGGGGLFQGSGGRAHGTLREGAFYRSAGGGGGGGIGGTGGQAGTSTSNFATAGGGGGIGPGGGGANSGDGDGGSGSDGGGYGTNSSGGSYQNHNNFSGGANAGGGAASDNDSDAAAAGGINGGSIDNTRNGATGGFGGGGGGAGGGNPTGEGGGGGFGGGGGGAGANLSGGDNTFGFGGYGGFGGGGGSAGFAAESTTGQGGSSTFGGGAGATADSTPMVVVVKAGVGGGQGGYSDINDFPAYIDAGGGGAGFGGAIFINNGGSLTVQGGCLSSANFVTAGTEGSGSHNAGEGYAVGNDLFAMSPTGSTPPLTFQPSSGTITFDGTIADDSAHSVPGGNDWTGGSGKGTQVIVTGPGTLELTTLLTSTYVGGTLVQNGATLAFNLFSAMGPAAITLNNGTLLSLSNPGAMLLQPLVLQSGNGTLNFAGNQVDLPNTITGTGSITLIGTSGGSVTFSSNGNLYLGNTLIQGTTLTAGTNNAFPVATQMQFLNAASQSALNLNNRNATIEGLSSAIGVNAAVFLGTGTLTINTNSLLVNDFEGIISGTGSIVIGGNGTQILSNANNYVGSTTLNSGTLEFGANNAIPAVSALTLTSPNATLDLHGFSGAIDSVSGVSGSNIALGSGTLTVGGSSSSSTYFGSISGLGGGLTKTGSGTFTFGQNSASYTGITNVTVGTVQAGTSNVLSPLSLVDIATGATLAMAGLNETIGGLSGDGNVLLGAGMLTITSSSSTPNDFGGAITGTTGSVIIAGSATQIFSGTSNSYSGATTIQSGTLQAAASGSLSPNSALFLTSSTSILDLQGNQSIRGLTGVSGSLIFLEANTLTLTGNANTTFAGMITGTGGLTLSEAAGTIFTLSGTATYVGPTIINDGSTLQGGATNAFPSGSLFTLNGQATVKLGNFSQNIGSLSSTSSLATVNLGNATLALFGNTGPTLFAGIITGSGNLILNDSAMVTLNGSSNNYSGSTNINNSATLEAGINGAFSPYSPLFLNGGGIVNINTFAVSTGPLTSSSTNTQVLLGAGSTLTLTGTQSTTYAGSISGSGGIIFNGTGTFTLAGAGLVTYLGSTILNSGTWAAGNQNVFSPSSSITMNNSAILALNNFSETVGFLSSNSPNTLVSLESGTLTLTGTTSTTYAGKIQGSGGIVLNQMAGTTWTWMSSFFSTYSGPTIVMNGNTLVAGNLDVFSPSSAVILQGSGTLLLNNNSQIIGPLSSTSSSSLVNLGSGILTVTGSLSSIFSGSILGTGGLTVDEALGTIFTLMGTSNTYSGTTTLQGGTLEAGAIGALSPSSSVVIERLLSGSVGILDLHDFDQSIPTLASVEASALVKLGSATLTLTGNHSTIYAGAITGTGGVTLNETDGAIFTVSGSNLNSYNGMTLLESGTLKANATNAFPFASFIEQDDATTLDLNGFDQDVQTLSSTSSTSKVLLGDGRLTLTSPISSTYAGMISGNTGGVTLAQSPGAIFTLVGMATYLGTTDVLGGTLRAGAMNVFPPNSSLVIGRLLSGSPGIVDLNDFDESAATLSSSDTGAQVLLGLATLTLTKNSSSSYGGSITGTGGLTLLGSSIFTLETSGISTYSGTTSVSNGTLRAGGNNAFSPHSSVFLSNGAVLDLHDHSETIPTLTSSDFTTKVLLGTGILTFTGTQSTTFDGAITGNGGIVLDETATFTLRGLNLYEGETVINSGVLAAGSNNTFSLLSPVEINNAGVLDLHDYFQSIDSLSSLSTGAMVFNGTSSLGTGILTLSGGRFNTAFTGVISGTGGLSKTGTSIFTLTNDNTYTGPTDISAGKIVVLGSLTSNVSVFSGGSLGGTGPFHGNVTIYAGGTDQPGDPTIQNIFGTYTQMAGSTLVIQITPTETDLVDVTGGPAVITGSTLKVTAARGTTYPQFMSYEIIRASGGVVGQFGSTVFSPLLLHPEVIYDAADVIIEFGFGLPVPSCITGNALSLLNYLNRENKIPHDSVQNILFDLEPVLTTCPLYLKALENLDPARYATLSLSSLELGLLFVNALDNRVMMNHARRSLRTKPSEIGLLSMTERTTIIPHGRVETAAADENSWDVWADGFDECIHGPEDSQNPAYNANLYGALLGVERLLKSGLVGFGAGYANGRIKEKQDFGLGKLQDVTGFFYGSAYVNNWYVDLGLFGAYLKINAERNFVLPLRNSTAESEHHAVQGTVHFATGYDFPTSWGTFEPFVLADWIWQCEGKVEESGTLFYNMHLRTRSFSELRSEAGLHYYQHWDRSWGMAILKETLAYVNKAPFGVGEIEAGLVGVPGIFLQNSYRDSQNLFRGGLQVFIQKGCDHYTSPFFSLSYDVEVGAGYLSNAVQGMLGFSF